MPVLPDLSPAAELTSSIVAGVTDDQLDRPTPCPDYAVCDILAHLDGLSVAFAAAAAKELGDMTNTPPGSADFALADGWRERIPSQLEALAQAWHDPSAWDGMTRAGGVDMPGEVAGIVALDEVVLHGWDLAKGTGQAYEPDLSTASVVNWFLVESRKGDVPEDLFGPVVEVGDDAQTFDHALGLAGRDPDWQPS
ncbi:TIGR03086 family metal-binding protein [Aeromicrobium sp.]|uniref:TIGR03086 family metal-binding protein n=1 Tax=Aeromicrobium sp. TaxID=1871063 RepID=UPI003D6C3F6B